MESITDTSTRPSPLNTPLNMVSKFNKSLNYNFLDIYVKVKSVVIFHVSLSLCFM